ncbi:MAG: hypothetical protein CM15mP106_7710 [Candidatus Neomarinimicrobiota bacterium]|nr:MAG: hypothetical protein CM15mP106_7710 [Candidatus Neomarinimicrobiota bacterium]
MIQLEKEDEYPDIVVGCTGGGSNFAGIALPFLGKSFRDNNDIELRAIKPLCLSFTYKRKVCI